MKPPARSNMPARANIQQAVVHEEHRALGHRTGALGHHRPALLGDRLRPHLALHIEHIGVAVAQIPRAGILGIAGVAIARTAAAA